MKVKTEREAGYKMDQSRCNTSEVGCILGCFGNKLGLGRYFGVLGT